MGKIYTGYCARVRDYPSNALLVGVMRFPPEWWKSINAKSLAPSADLLRSYQSKQIDTYIFKQKFLEELRERGLAADKVREAFELITVDRDVILCCYERPTDFCHRHILAEWLGGNIDEFE